MNDLLARTLQTCRLAPPGPRTQRFTVDRGEALLRQRGPAHDRWGWSLHVVRAVFALTDGAQVVIRHHFPTFEHEQVRLALRLDAASLAGLAHTTLLDAALDPGKRDHDGSLPERQHRFLHRLGRAANQAFMRDTTSVQVYLAGRCHDFIRHADAPGGWIERIVDTWPEGVDRSTVVFDVRLVPDYLSRENLIGEGGASGLLNLWKRDVPGLEAQDGVWHLRPFPSARCMQLGEDARWWRLGERPLMLVRDGVVMPTRLAGAIANHAVQVLEFPGIVDVPRLRLTYDEQSVIEDEALSVLAAWFHDVVAHAVRGRRSIVSLFADRQPSTPGPIVTATWSTTIEHAYLADGSAVSLATLREMAQWQVAVVFVWRHEANTTPPDLRATTLVLWPSEYEVLRRAVPTLQLVPLARAQVARGHAADWKTLVRGSLPELSLCVLPRTVELPVRVEVSAFVHRGGNGELGSIDLAYQGNTIGRTTDPAFVIPGVSVVAYLTTSDAAWSATPTATSKLLHAVARAARDRLDMILEHCHASLVPGMTPPAVIARIEAGSITPIPELVDTDTTTVRTTVPLAVVPVRGHGFTGVLELHADDEPSILELGVVDGPSSTITLQAPFLGVTGRIAIEPDVHDLHATTLAALRQLVPIVNRAALVHPLGPLRDRLVALLAACRASTAIETTSHAVVAPALRDALVFALDDRRLAPERVVVVPSWTIAAWSDDTPPRLELGGYRRWLTDGMHRPRDHHDVALAAALVIVGLEADAAARERALLRLFECARRWA